MSEKKTPCPWPAVAAWLSWTQKTSEEEARSTVNQIAQWPDPVDGAAQFDRCESPAERLFLLGGVINNEYGVSIQLAPDGAHGVGILRLVSGEDFTLLQQHELAGYRVDFFIYEAKLVIEIDGHDFHERTKEQAAADRQRDRWLLASGYRVARFTGSEVYQDPSRCLAECVRIATALNDAEEDIWREAKESALEQFTAPPQLVATSGAAE